MADKEVKVKDGVTVTDEAVFIGDYMFKIDGNLIQKYKKKQDAIHGDVAEYEEKVKGIMAKHYAFYGKFQKENQYVKRGSILKCSGGTKLTKFDLLKDHGVMELGGGQIGICSDCKSNHNIYSFGVCNKPTPSGYPERPLEIPTLNSKFPFLMHKCIPLLNGNWSKTNSGKLRVWDEEKKEYCDAITTGDYLTCFYGGIISVIEVPLKENGYKQMMISPKGITMIANFELSIGTAKATGIGEFDKQGNMIGIYPHYVFKLVNGNWVSDGGITLGHGYYVSKSIYETNKEAKKLIDKYAYGASFKPSYIPTNGLSYKVKGSSYMPVKEETVIYNNKLKDYVNAVNDFLKSNNIRLNQNQFDALVSFTYQYGTNWWELDKVLPEYIRQGKGTYAPDEVRKIFNMHDDPARRAKEAEVFINGYSKED